MIIKYYQRQSLSQNNVTNALHVRTWSRPKMFTDNMKLSMNLGHETNIKTLRRLLLFCDNIDISGGLETKIGPGKNSSSGPRLLLVITNLNLNGL